LLRRQQPINGLQRLLQGSLILFDHLTSRLAHPFPLLVIRKEGQYLFGEIICVENPTTPSCLD
jgi:hypothetical protein